jgi:hypothetical protein
VDRSFTGMKRYGICHGISIVQAREIQDIRVKTVLHGRQSCAISGADKIPTVSNVDLVKAGDKSEFEGRLGIRIRTL